MIERVISGGQTGADQAGLRAAQACGIPTGGYAPRGWLTEAGSAPGLGRYGLVECPEPKFECPDGMPLWQWNAILYTARTKRNAEWADTTVWFGDLSSRGALATWRAFQRKGDDRSKIPPPLYADGGWTVVTPQDDDFHLPPANLAYGLRRRGSTIVNIAGNRESKSPGIGAWVESYLVEVFRLMGGNAG